MEKEPENISQLLQNYFQENKVAIYLPAYNGELKICQVFERIPTFIRDNVAEIYVVDNQSNDRTAEVVRKYAEGNNLKHLIIYTMESNRVLRW